MVSVIITTYKGASTLARAVQSVLDQKYEDYELIVVDDNDPESEGRHDTEEIMRQFVTNSKVKYIRHERNMNGSVARNTGIRVSKGDFVSFLDDDDVYLPERLQECVSVANETGKSIVYTDVIILKEEVPCGYVQAVKNGNLLIDLLIDENIFGTGSNLFVRKTVIDEIGGFNESLKRHQDYEFLLRAFHNGGDAIAIRKCLVIKSMNQSNNSAKYQLLKEIKYSLLESYKKEIKETPVDTRRQILVNHHLELLHTAYIDKDSNAIREQKWCLRNLGWKDTMISRLKGSLLRGKTRTAVQFLGWMTKRWIVWFKHRNEYKTAMQIYKK